MSIKPKHHCKPQTYAHEVCMPINGKVVCVDYCVSHIVAALNAGGVRTVSSCCGHGKFNGHVILEDGQFLDIYPSLEDWKKKFNPNNRRNK